MHYSQECYVICRCSICNGREWHDLDDLIDHLRTLRDLDVDTFELEIIDVEQS